MMASLGSCLEAGFTECCQDASQSCTGSPTFDCYCDVNCHVFGDCCYDIEHICPASNGNLHSGNLKLNLVCMAHGPVCPLFMMYEEDRAVGIVSYIILA